MCPNSNKICVFCESQNTKKIQIRQNKSIKKQIYLCLDCKRKFTPDNEFKKFRHSPFVIKATLELLKKGSSLAQTVSYLNQTFRINISRKTIFDWKKKFLSKEKLVIS